jgi:hypothetical protein
LKERRDAAHAGLRRRYRAFLRIPEWTDDELSEMGLTAVREIQAAIEMRDWVRWRLRYRGETFVNDERAVFALARAVAS